MVYFDLDHFFFNELKKTLNIMNLKINKIEVFKLRIYLIKIFFYNKIKTLLAAYI